MNKQPRLDTLGMIEAMIKKHSQQYSIFQLWKRLPKKMMYQTYKTGITYLLEQGRIMMDSKHRLCYRKTAILPPLSREALLYNLAHYGYPLILLGPKRKHKIIELELLITHIIITAPEARFIEAIPTLLYKHTINAFTLYHYAALYGFLNRLGYLLEMSLAIAQKKKKQKPELQLLLKQCQEKKEITQERFDPTQSSLFDKLTPKSMKKWNTIGRFTLEDFYKEEYL